MESVFKLTRAEVERACTQFLRKNGVNLANTAKLVGEASFEDLHFSGEVSLVAPVLEHTGPGTGALDLPAYGAAVERAPVERAMVERAPVQRVEVASARPAPAPVAPPAAAPVTPPAPAEAAAPVEKSATASSLETPVPARPAGSKPRFKEGVVGGSVPGLTGGSHAGMGKQLGKLMSDPPSTVKLPPSVVDFRDKA